MAVMDVIEPSKKAVKKHLGMWWSGGGVTNPMTDAEFVQAFCEHVFRTTADRSVVTVRNRAYRFIRTFMAPQMEAELTRYREDYP